MILAAIAFARGHEARRDPQGGTSMYGTMQDFPLTITAISATACSPRAMHGHHRDG